MSERILVRKCINSEKSSALEFVRHVYGQRLGTAPAYVNGVLIGAFSGGQIQGVISVRLGDAAFFEVEKHFKINLNELYLNRGTTASFSRWAAQSQDVSLALAYAAVKYALDSGMTHCLNSAKPALCRMLRRKYGIKLDMIHAQVDLEKIAPDDRNFFASDPQPCVYRGNLSQWYNAFSSHLPDGVDVLV